MGLTTLSTMDHWRYITSVGHWTYVIEKRNAWAMVIMKKKSGKRKEVPNGCFKQEYKRVFGTLRLPSQGLLKVESLKGLYRGNIPHDILIDKLRELNQTHWSETSRTCTLPILPPPPVIRALEYHILSRQSTPMGKMQITRPAFVPWARVWTPSHLA